MDYMDIARAIEQPGLRLVLTQGVPGPWGEAAKAVFRLRGVPFTPVAQRGGEDNPDLVAWVRHRNAPVAVYNSEPPRVRWLEIVELAERLGEGPSLLPATLEERIAAVGLTNEIAGESGFAWHGRLLMLAAMHQMSGDSVLSTPMFREYGYSSEAVQQASERASGFLSYLSDKWAGQKALGSHYLVGNQLSVADVYWAYFSQLLEALPPDQNPMPDFLRTAWGAVAEALGSYDSALIAQRNEIFSRHLWLPLEF